MHRWIRQAAGFLLLAAFCALCDCRNATDVLSPPGHDAPPPPSESSISGALKYLACAQNKDGSWGESGTNRPLLTALATLAYLSWREDATSERYGATVKSGLNFALSEAEETNGVSAWKQFEPDAKSATVWCLAEAYCLTVQPSVRDALLRVLKDWQPDGSCPFDLFATRAIRLSRIEPVAPYKQVAIAILARPATNQLVLALQILAGYEARQHSRTKALASGLLDSCSNDWPRGEFPIATVLSISHALYNADSPVSTAWDRQFSPRCCQNQFVCGTNRWWTSHSFGIESSTETARFSPREERIYTTALTIIAHPYPYRHLPLYYEQLENSAGTNDESSVRVTVR